MRINVPIEAPDATRDRVSLLATVEVEIPELPDVRPCARSASKGIVYRHAEGMLWRALHHSDHGVIPDASTPLLDRRVLRDFSDDSDVLIAMEAVQINGGDGDGLKTLHAVNRHLHRHRNTGAIARHRAIDVVSPDRPELHDAVCAARSSVGRLALIGDVLHAPTSGPGFQIIRDAKSNHWLTGLIMDGGNSWPGTFYGIDEARDILDRLRAENAEEVPSRTAIEEAMLGLEILDEASFRGIDPTNAEIEAAGWWMVVALSRAALGRMDRSNLVDYATLLTRLRERAAALGIPSGNALNDPTDRMDVRREDATELRYLMRRLKDCYHQHAVPLRNGDLLDLLFSKGYLSERHDPDLLQGLKV